MNNTQESKDQLIQALEAAEREIEIQKALERVRARALGMQESAELADVATTLGEAARELLPAIKSNYIAFDDTGEGDVRFYGSTDRRSGYYQSSDDLPFLAETRAERKTGSAYYIYRYTEGGRVGHRIFHAYGWITYMSERELSDDDIGVLKRLTAVFDFAYKRFMELEVAEEQARQAEHRSAVDHIRAEIAAMQTTEDFERVTPLLWKTLKVLGVPFIRCGFTIHDREAELHHMNLSDPNGNPMAVLTVPVDRHPYTRNAWDCWAEGEVYVQSFTRDEFVELQLALQTGLESLEGERYVIPESLPDRLVAHTVPFSHGTLYVNSTEYLSREDLALIGDLAGAFSVAYARYQDFRRLEKQNEDLEEASRVKSQFLANMSHELRTPMNAIIGFTRLVLRRGAENLSPRHRENLEKVTQSADHLLTLINDVLDLSKIEANKLDIKADRFIVSDLISACCATVSPLVKDGVELSYELDDEVGAAYQDAARLRQVVINLLSNALKFTDEGEVKVMVRHCKLQIENSQLQIANASLTGLEITVADTGSGIPDDKLEMIFDEFSQVDNSATRKYQGTGLGLSICKMLTELMGGEISVESAVGEGSTFTVRLPMTYGAK